LILQQATHIFIIVLQRLIHKIFVLQSLGNHEFDDGVDGLVPFINNAAFPILASNLDLRKEKDLNVPNLKKSVVFDLDGVKVAVIGYITPDTKVRDYRVTKNCKTHIHFNAIILNIRI
jgi:2',3'-cyclic-nucleotide 2'-phosphodiesterase (5'-nucleotidase family)